MIGRILEYTGESLAFTELSNSFFKRVLFPFFPIRLQTTFS